MTKNQHTSFFYVNGYAKKSGDGTQEKPFKTMQQAFDAIPEKSKATIFLSGKTKRVRAT